MAINKDLDFLREELEIHKKNLGRLKLQKAGHGSLNVPLHILNQIEDEEKEIKRLEKEIGEPDSNGYQSKEGFTMIKILFLAANPIDKMQLSLGEESRAIDKALRQTEFRDRFDIKQHQAVRVGDIQECLLRHKPHIVHFSGHGSESSEIILQDSSGRSYSVPSKALSNRCRC